MLSGPQYTDAGRAAQSNVCFLWPPARPLQSGAGLPMVLQVCHAAINNSSQCSVLHFPPPNRRTGKQARTRPSGARGENRMHSRMLYCYDGAGGFRVASCCCDDSWLAGPQVSPHTFPWIGVRLLYKCLLVQPSAPSCCKCAKSAFRDQGIPADSYTSSVSVKCTPCSLDDVTELKPVKNSQGQGT